MTRKTKKRGLKTFGIIVMSLLALTLGFLAFNGFAVISPLLGQGIGDGLIARYYPALNFEGDPYITIDDTINFNWGSGKPLFAPADSFSVVWEGYIEPRYTENYTFSTISDDGVRLYINNKLVIDNWSDHAATTNTGLIFLTGGVKYPIKLEYYEKTGSAVITLRWSSNTQFGEIVPESRLYTENDDLIGVQPEDQTPQAPRNLLATRITNDSVSLVWNSSEVTDQIYRNGILVTTASLDQYTDSRLLSNTTYQYYIKAVNSGIVSNASNLLTVRTLANSVPVVSVRVNDIIVDNSQTSNVLTEGSWRASSYIPGYYGSNYLYGLVRDGSISASFVPNIITSGNYNIYAWWSSNNERATNVPIQITGSLGTSTVTVNQRLNSSSWYYLGRYNFSSGTSGRVKFNVAGTNGDVVVDAIKLVYSNQSSPVIVVPSAPALTGYASSTSLVSLSWNDVSGETAYSLERSTSATSGFTQIASLGENVVTYSNTGLISGTTYYYRIRASNSAGSSAYSNVLIVQTQNVPTQVTEIATNKPTTSSSIENANYPANLATDGNSGTRWASAYSDPQWIMVDLQNTYAISNVYLYWEYASARSYQIQVSNDGSTWTNIYSTTTSAGGRENLTGLNGNGRYVRVYMTARNTQWGYSIFDLKVYGSSSSSPVVTPPTTPSGLSGTVSSNTVQIAWNDVSGETSYSLERSTSATSGFTQIASLGANVITYSDSGLTSGTTYYYRIRASNSAGSSAYSSVVSVLYTYTPVTIPVQPTNFVGTFSSTNRAISLSWNDVSGETAYSLERSTSLTTGYVVIASLGANVVSYSDSNIASSTTYYYRIRASNSAGNSAYSSIFSVTTNNFDSGTQYYVSTTGSDSNSGTITSPWRTIQYAINQMNGRSQGAVINIRGGSYTEVIWIDGVPGLTVRAYPGETVRIFPTGGAANTIIVGDEDGNNRGLKIQGLDVTGGAFYALKLEGIGAAGVIVENNKFHDAGTDVIKLAGSYEYYYDFADGAIIRNNEIYNSGTAGGTNAQGIDAIGGDGIIISGNYIHDVVSEGAFIKMGARNGIIENNRIVNVRSGAGISFGVGESDCYVFNAQINPSSYECINCIARNNIVVNSNSAGIGLGGTYGSKVYNNLFYNVAQNGQAGAWVFNVDNGLWIVNKPNSCYNFHTIVNTNMDIRNNIFVMGSSRPGIQTSTVSGTNIVDNNLFYRLDGGTTTFVGINPTNSLFANPLVSTSNYHLSTGSPAIDRGLNLASTGFSTDYDGESRPKGSAWDLGADEY
jgi:hypothetical protein